MRKIKELIIKGMAFIGFAIIFELPFFIWLIK